MAAKRVICRHGGEPCLITWLWSASAVPPSTFSFFRIGLSAQPQTCLFSFGGQVSRQKATSVVFLGASCEWQAA
jgi:hypothetical protein